MILQDWLTRNGLSHAAFAHQIGVSPATVGRWVRGTRVPRPVLALQIQQQTGGHVPVGVWTATDHLPKGPAALVRWMRERGLTVLAMARHLCVSHTSISNWVGGTAIPSRESLEAINAVTGLGLSAADFAA